MKSFVIVLLLLLPLSSFAGNEGKSELPVHVRLEQLTGLKGTGYGSNEEHSDEMFKSIWDNKRNQSQIEYLRKNSPITMISVGGMRSFHLAIDLVKNRGVKIKNLIIIDADAAVLEGSIRDNPVGLEMAGLKDSPDAWQLSTIQLDLRSPDTWASLEKVLGSEEVNLFSPSNCRQTAMNPPEKELKYPGMKTNEIIEKFGNKETVVLETELILHRYNRRTGIYDTNYYTYFLSEGLDHWRGSDFRCKHENCYEMHMPRSWRTASYLESNDDDDGFW